MGLNFARFFGQNGTCCHRRNVDSSTICAEVFSMDSSSSRLARLPHKSICRPIATETTAGWEHTLTCNHYTGQTVLASTST